MADAKLNLSKLESRPRPDERGNSSFYADIDCDANEPAAAAALEKRGPFVGVRLLGSYDIAAKADGRAPVVDATKSRPVQQHSLAVATTGGAELPSSAKNWPKAARPTIRPGRGYASAMSTSAETSSWSSPGLVRWNRATKSSRPHKRFARVARSSCEAAEFKPRTSPYAFQGLGWEGVDLLAEAEDHRSSDGERGDERRSSGANRALGRRSANWPANMQNFDLLKAVGKTNTPVLLKRGLWRASTSSSPQRYVLSEGNPHVILCERGIRTFETATRNTLESLVGSRAARANAPAHPRRSLARCRRPKVDTPARARSESSWRSRNLGRGSPQPCRSQIGRRASAHLRRLRANHRANSEKSLIFTANDALRHASKPN